VKIDSTGKLGTVLSSARYKEAIKPMDKASESILRLRPITFRYKKEFDPDGVTQFGLVAEDVEKVCPDLVVSDENGKPLTVRYEAVNAMLLNEFLKEHRKVEEQEGTITQLKSSFAKQEVTISKLESTLARQNKEFQSTVAQQQKEIEALTMGLQRVNDRLEATTSAPRLVADNQ
jgi:trimeric autotransporter adhesin